mgnify:FL=1|jgi:hypothetical protein
MQFYYICYEFITNGIIAKNTAFVKRAAFSLKMRGFPDIFTDCFFGQKERNHPGFPRQFPLLYD